MIFCFMEMVSILPLIEGTQTFRYGRFFGDVSGSALRSALGLNQGRHLSLAFYRGNASEGFSLGDPLGGRNSSLGRNASEGFSFPPVLPKSRIQCFSNKGQ